MDSNNNSNDIYNLDQELDVNEKNQEQYNHLIEHSRQKDDIYWDRNNPIVKILLIVLFAIAVIGTIYYVMLWFSSK